MGQGREAWRHSPNRALEHWSLGLRADTWFFSFSMAASNFKVVVVAVVVVVVAVVVVPVHLYSILHTSRRARFTDNASISNPTGQRQDVEVGRVLVRVDSRCVHRLACAPLGHADRYQRLHTPSPDPLTFDRQNPGHGTPGRTKTAAGSVETPLNRRHQTVGIPATSRRCVSGCARMPSTCSASTSGSRHRARADAPCAERPGNSRPQKKRPPLHDKKPRVPPVLPLAIKRTNQLTYTSITTNHQPRHRPRRRPSHG